MVARGQSTTSCVDHTLGQVKVIVCGTLFVTFLSRLTVVTHKEAVSTDRKMASQSVERYSDDQGANVVKVRHEEH